MKRHSLITAIFVAAAMILAPAALKADWTYSNGTITDGTWTLNVSVASTTNLTVTGVSTAPGSASALDLSTAVTDGGSTAYTIVSIGNNAFYNSTIISSVTLPNSVTTIGGSAFRNCTALTSAVLSDTLISMGSDAFSGDTALVTVTPFLPDTFTSFSGDCHFNGCAALTGDLVITNSGLTSIPGSAFSSTKITSVDMSGSGVKTIGGTVFWQCTALTNVALSDTLTSIGSDAFSRDTALVSVTPFLPDTLTSLPGNYQFNECTSLTGDLRLSNANLVKIDSQAFYKTKITSVDMSGSGIETIAGNVFGNCGMLTNAVMSEVLSTVGSSAFSSAVSLTNFYFTGEPPASFSSDCFNNIPQYTTRVFVPRFDPLWENFAAANVTSPLTDDETSAFKAAHPEDSLPVGIWGISSTKLWYSDKPYEGTDAFYVIGEPVNAGEVSPAYGITNIAANTAIQCSAPANAIFEGKYYVCTGSVTEDETSDHVWANAVTNSGTNVTVPKSETCQQRLTWLWDFNGYFVNTTNDYGEGTVTFDPVSPFNNNCYTDGTKVTLTAEPADSWYFRRWVGDVPEADATNTTVTVTVDGPKSCNPMFTHGWTYSNNTITDGNWTLKVSVGDNNTLTITGVDTVTSQSVLDLGTPVIGDDDTTQYTIVSLGDDAFENRTELVSVYLPETLTYIGGSVFESCSALKRVTPFLPGAVTNLGREAFAYCSVLEGDLVLTNSEMKVINYYTFEKCEKITSANLPYVETFAEEEAFWSCVSLTNVILSENLSYIGTQTFDGCRALEHVTPFLPASVTYIGANAFSGCLALMGDLKLLNPALTKINANDVFPNTKITSVYMPYVIETGYDMFYNCLSLTNVVLSENLTKLGGCTFQNCTALNHIEPLLPDTIISFGDGSVFQGVPLTGMALKLTSPNLKTLNNNLFSGTKIVSADMLNSGITFIDHDCFYYCTSLTNVFLPDTLENLGGSSGCAFQTCTALKDIYFSGDAPFFGRQCFDRIDAYKIRIHIPKNNASWEDFGKTNASPFAELTADEVTKYETAFPGEPLPYCTWIAPTSQKQWVCKWLPPKDTLRTTVLILQ